MNDLLVPRLASSFAFALMFVAFMVVTVWLETSAPPSPIMVVRGAFGFFALGLVIQFAYGGLVYVILTRASLWNIWTVSLAYLLPVALFGWHASDTTQDILGTIRWLVFALIVAVVSWFFATGPITFSRPLDALASDREDQ
jgi:hypothetical protein